MITNVFLRALIYPLLCLVLICYLCLLLIDYHVLSLSATYVFSLSTTYVLQLFCFMNVFHFDVRKENSLFTDSVIFAFIKQGSLRKDLK